MPKLKKQDPKNCRDRNQSFSWYNGKRIYHGVWGSPEAKKNYRKFCAALDENPDLPLVLGESGGVLVSELADGFLNAVGSGTIRMDKSHTTHFRLAIGYLVDVYGDLAVNEFSPKKLNAVRNRMVHGGALCRNMVNDYTRRIVRIFKWGVREEVVKSDIITALRTLEALPEGHTGTFDHPEREDVPDDIIIRTLPFMPPTLRAMVKLQRLTGCRPSEIFNMRVGEIDKDADPELWLYRLRTHKTQKKTKRKKIIPLGQPEQELLAPFLVGKNTEAAVFSPRTAQQERYDGKRAIPKKYSEFYNRDSYRRAIWYAIAKGNRALRKVAEKAGHELSESEMIPPWTPYQLRHSASSAMEVEVDFEASHVLLDHTTPNTTARYNHRRLEKLKELARNRRNPFDTSDLANGQAAE